VEYWNHGIMGSGKWDFGLSGIFFLTIKLLTLGNKTSF
jgi:hypothetical protein